MAYSPTQKKNIIEDICLQIAEKGISLRKVLMQNKMPAMSTWASWINGDDQESKQYARMYEVAIELRAELHFDELLDIADDVGEDVILNDEGFPVENHKVIQRDRLRIDTRKWILARMLPKKFGDKVSVETKPEDIKPLQLVLIPPKKSKK